MEYLSDLANSVGKNSKSYLPVKEMLYNNPVMKNFKSLEYDIVIVESELSPPENYLLVDDIICHTKKMDSMLLDTVTRASMIGYFVERYDEEKKRDQIKCAFSEIKTIGNIKDKPIFAFIHIVLPHPPFIFGPNGESIIPGNPISSEIWDEKVAYIDQLKFANKEITKVIEKILDENEKSIIILQSDHGSGFDIDWKNPDKSMMSQRLSILNAYYAPEISKNQFHENITPVNSFRIVFNEYFNGNYEMLEDRNYWNHGGAPWDFHDVTEIIGTNSKK
jgi:hypothetical protein